MDSDKQIKKIIKETGVKLIPDGQNWKGQCPFHSDTEYSLIINSEKNYWQCLGDCNTGGSVVEWIMKIEGISKSHATELLQREYPVNAVTTDALVKYSSVRRLDAPFNPDDNDQEILQQVLNFYHETLKQSPEAIGYLNKWGMNNNEVIEKFNLGYCNRTLGYRLPDKNRKEGAILRGRLQRIGILKPSGHELFQGSIVIPIMEDGIIKQIYGRKTAQKLRPGTPFNCYLPSSKQGFFNLKAVQVCDELIICSSVIDALTFWCADYKNVTCSYGVDQFVGDDLDTIKKSSLKRVLIAYAGNETINTAATKLVEQLTELGIDCYRIEFPKNVDVNTHALSNKPINNCLGELIRKAAWLSNGHEAPISQVLESIDETVNVEVNDTIVDVESSLNQANANELPNEACTLPETPKSLPSSVLPLPPVTIKAEIKDDEIVMCLGARRYRVRGLNKNLCIDQLKVNLLVTKEAALHVDSFDLYASRPRANYIKQAAIELDEHEDVIKKDLGKILLKLELLQDKNIQNTLAPKSHEYELTKLEKDEALDFLKSPNLLQRLLEDYQRCGVVGEKTNKLVGYLAALSRKLEKPLAIMIQSNSAAGKSALMDAVLSFIPEEERVQYSAMTGQSLFYMGDINLKHKILAISEEEGASQATYALKLLQSEGQLTIASTGKDPDSGRHVTREYKVEGPVMIFSTTTAIDIDEELLNRCIVLSVDENRAQTKAIHDYQRYEETLEGLQISQVRDDIIRIQRNAQRLIKPYKVVNPFARQLTFLDDKTRTRRDHKKYLTLINSITLLHQYQRVIKKIYYKGKSIPYIEVALDDIDIANQLAHEVLGSSLDEIPPQTRRLLQLINTMVTERCNTLNVSKGDYRFSRRDVRNYTHWGDTQLKVHIKRLETMEYLLIHRGGRGRQFIYELLYNREGQDGKPFLMGLIDIETLKNQDSNQVDINDNLSASSRLGVGVIADTSQQHENTSNLFNNNSFSDDSHQQLLTTVIEKNIQYESYRNLTTRIPKGGDIQ